MRLAVLTRQRPSTVALVCGAFALTIVAVTIRFFVPPVRGVDDRLVIENALRVLHDHMIMRVCGSAESDGMSATEAWNDILCAQRLSKKACPLQNGLKVEVSADDALWKACNPQTDIAIAYPYPVVGYRDKSPVYIAISFDGKTLRSKTPFGIYWTVDKGQERNEEQR